MNDAGRGWRNGERHDEQAQAWQAPGDRLRKVSLPLLVSSGVVLPLGFAVAVAGATLVIGIVTTTTTTTTTTTIGILIIAVQIFLESVDPLVAIPPKGRRRMFRGHP